MGVTCMPINFFNRHHRHARSKLLKFKQGLCEAQFLKWHRAAADVRVALPGEGVSLESWLDGDRGEVVTTTTALEGDVGGLGSNGRGTDDDPRYLDQMRHLLRLVFKGSTCERGGACDE